MILLELVELVAASHKPSVAPGDGVIVSCACRLWTAADMERLVERLEKAVERLENVCQGPGMCGDASAKGEARGTSQGTAELAQGSLWGSQTGGSCPVGLKTQWLQHFLSPGLSLLQVGGAARGCGSLWGAPADLCALFFPQEWLNTCRLLMPFWLGRWLSTPRSAEKSVGMCRST